MKLIYDKRSRYENPLTFPNDSGLLQKKGKTFAFPIPLTKKPTMNMFFGDL
jgi:hypothetical protein